MSQIDFLYVVDYYDILDLITKPCKSHEFLVDPSEQKLLLSTGVVVSYRFKPLSLEVKIDRGFH